MHPNERWVPIRVRAGDVGFGLMAPRVFRTTDVQSRIVVEGGIIRFNVSDGREARVYLTLDDVDENDLPWPVWELTRPCVIGVSPRYETIGDGEVRLDTQFYEDGRIIRSREVDSKISTAWFDVPPKSDGVGLTYVLTGVGEVHLDSVELVLPAMGGSMPAGTDLVNALSMARFPKGSMNWLASPRSYVDAPHQVRVGDVEIDPVPPCDWSRIASEERSLQLFVHGFAFADAVLQNRDPASVEWLAALLFDWEQAHPLRPHSTTEMSWNDMAVANRAMVIMHLLDHARSSVPSRVVGLAQMLAEHARWLAHDRNHIGAHDHGLFTDTALEYSARVLSVHTLSDRWRRRARERFSETARMIIDADEGTVLEHSPAYVDAVADLVRQRRSDGLRDGLPHDLEERFSETLGLLTTPDGQLIPWGDTEMEHLSERPRPRGVFTFERTGWGVSHLETQTVGLTASYHSSNHKHGDELSVVWHETQGPILTEAGAPSHGYKGDSARSYAVSGLAHNSVVLNDTPIEWRDEMPYDSGIWFGDDANNWHLLGGYNPLQTVGKHERFVAHAKERLLIVDLLTGADIAAVTRHFHLHGRLGEAHAGSECVRFDEWSFRLWSERGDAAIDLDTGSVHFPDSSTTAHHTLLSVRDRGPGIRVLAAGRRGSGFHVHEVDVSGQGDTVRIDLRTSEGETLSWTRTLTSGGRGRLEWQDLDIDL